VPGVLDGQVAIVTGSGRGLGRAISEQFVAGGAAVCLTQRSQEQLDQVAESIGPSEGVIAVAGDVTDQSDVERVVHETESRLGPVTLLVNNAGIHGPLGPFGVVDPWEWWRTQEVHVRGAFLFTNAIMPGMVRRRGGRIITIASRAGLHPSTNFSAYSLAKATQIRLTELVAAEGKEHGIFAFAVQPGTISSQLTQSIMTSPDANRWLPKLVEHLIRIDQNADAEEAKQRCAEVCVKLAAGHYDVLSGRYLDVNWDLDVIAAEASVGAEN
jgi:NAD(P)-dependent dehydrogenase (short-subunit alcohol dehydrogenase family)